MSDTLSRLARLYEKFPECWLPPGWNLQGHDRRGMEIVSENALLSCRDDWEAVGAIALGRLDCWLEDNGWHVIKQKCGRWCIFRMCSFCFMDHRLEPHGEPEFNSRIEAAISAAEIVAGLEVGT